MTVNPMPPRRMSPPTVKLVGRSREKAVRLSLKVENPALQNAEMEWKQACQSVSHGVQKNGRHAR
jgi:hypothetical protein